MIDINATIGRLSTRRPIFHSEADFQHELAWEIHIANPVLKLRLEQPFPGRASGAIDLVISDGVHSHGLELKYLTRQFHTVHDGEEFNLKQHDAQDLRRYDICRDIERMEDFATRTGCTASVIAISNDRNFWQGRKRSGTIAEAFEVSDGRIVNGNLRWAPHTGAGTMKGRMNPISICGSHSCTWRGYSDLGDNGQFQFLHVQIENALGPNTSN